MPTKTYKTITVDGDRVPSAYRLPAHTLSEKDKNELLRIWGKAFWADIFPDREYGFFLRSGADILYHTLRGMTKGSGTATAPAANPSKAFVAPVSADTVNILAKIDEKESDGRRKVVIRLAEDGEIPLGSLVTSLKTSNSGFSGQSSLSTGSLDPRLPDVAILAHWLMPLHDLEKYRSRKDPCVGKIVLPAKGHPCDIHIQIGLLDGDTKRKRLVEPDKTVGPHRLATPTKARIIVTCLDEICPHVRVRRALSYDSIVVDLLSVARGFERKPDPSPEFKRMIGLLEDPKVTLPLTFVVIRINNAAALLYRWDPAKRGEQREAAWLLFHKDRSAPIIDPGKGRMLGYNTRIGAVIAAVASSWTTGSIGDEIMVAAVERAIRVQYSHFAEGFGNLTCKRLKNGWISEQAIEDSAKESWKQSGEGTSPIHKVKIDVADAVARHSQWFITKNWEAGGDATQLVKNGDEQFKAFVYDWLCGKYKRGCPKSEDRRPANTIPTVPINSQLLVDRREIEDYLSLRGEMISYAINKRAGTVKRPLNLAVFG